MRAWVAALEVNRLAYVQASPVVQRAMARRALRMAALTIHTQWVVSVRRWEEGRGPVLPAAQAFLRRRLRLPPSAWVAVNPAQSVKAQFARALLGYEDAACYDIWTVRAFPSRRGRQWRGSTVWQWALWLHRLYPAVYPHQRGTVIPEHIRILEWVRTGRKGRRAVVQQRLRFGP